MTAKDDRLVALSLIPTRPPVDYERNFMLTTDVEWLQFAGMDQDELAARANDVDVVVGSGAGDWPQPDFHQFPNLRAVLLLSVGVEAVQPDMIPEGCIVTNTFEHEQSIADWVFMTMMLLSRNAFGVDKAFRDGTLRPLQETGGFPLDMSDSTLGVIGLGHVGSRTVQIARAHDIRCVVTMRTPISDEEARERGIDQVYPMDGLHEMLAECDFVVPAIPLIDSTRGLIGKAEFEEMKESAFIINVSRGPVLDERATYEALNDGTIAGAGIDVWWDEDPEGLQTDDPERRKWSEYPFWELDNVLMSPHRSGFTTSMLSGKIKFTGRQLDRMNRGEPLENVILNLSKAPIT